MQYDVKFAGHQIQVTLTENLRLAEGHRMHLAMDYDILWEIEAMMKRFLGKNVTVRK